LHAAVAPVNLTGMPNSKGDRIFINFSNLALLVVAVMTLAMALASREFEPLAARGFLFYGFLVVYAAGGVFANIRLLGKVPVPLERGYFLLQLAFYAAMVRCEMPHGAIWLLMMPVVSQAAVRLPWPGLVVVSAAYLGINSALPEIPGWSGAERWRTALSLLSAFVFVIVMTKVVESARQARERAETLAGELEQANAQLRAAAAQAAELAAATERNRIARDIHDGLGHYLTVVAVQLQAARALLPASPERAGEALAKAEELARGALTDVRRSVGALREPDVRPLLRSALEGLTRESGLPAVFEVEGQPRPLPDPVEQALFRTVQEALTNVRKHAGPAQVRVRLDYRDGRKVGVEVTDSGCGCPADAATGGFGLAGLRERLAAVGGLLTAGNGAGGGFVVRAEVAA
jgi:signal transduction histidine kinase